MTQNKVQKAAIRRRMAETGESYVVARRIVLGEANGADSELGAQGARGAAGGQGVWGAAEGAGLTPDSLEMKITRPWPRASMPGSAARMVRTIDRTLRSQALAKTSGAESSTVPSGTMPAQLKRMSIGPTSRASARCSAC